MSQAATLADLKPRPDDMIVIPEDMVVEGEAPCHVYRMKFLHQPSIVRSGGYNSMGFFNNFSGSSLARWLGLDTAIGESAQAEPLPAVNEMTPMVDLNHIYKLAPIPSAEATPVLEAKFQEVTLQNGQVVVKIEPVKSVIEKFYRYSRNTDLIKHLDGVSAVTSPRGGMAFYVELDVETNSFAFSYAICHDNDNFKKSTARAISKGRFDTDDWYEVENYDPKCGILENIDIALHKYLHNAEKEGIIGPRFSSVSPKMKLQELKRIFERI